MLEYLIFTGLVIIITALMIRQKNKKLTKNVEKEKKTPIVFRMEKVLDNMLEVTGKLSSDTSSNKDIVDYYIDEQLDLIRGDVPDTVIDNIGTISHLAASMVGQQLIRTNKIYDRHQVNIENRT